MTSVLTTIAARDAKPINVGNTCRIGPVRAHMTDMQRATRSSRYSQRRFEYRVV